MAIQNCGYQETLMTWAQMGRATETDAMQAKVLTDEARRVAANTARLPELLGHKEWKRGSDPRMRTTKPANRRQLGSSQVVVRFALRLALLSTFAVDHEGYARTLAGFLLLSAVCCAAVGAARREAVFGPVLTHWDEAAVYGLVGCGAAAFA
jgi:hypothetical protein